MPRVVDFIVKSMFPCSLHSCFLQGWFFFCFFFPPLLYLLCSNSTERSPVWPSRLQSCLKIWTKTDIKMCCLVSTRCECFLLSPTPHPQHAEIMFPFLKQIVWYSGTIFSVSVNTTIFTAAITDSEQLGNSVYANEAKL